MTLIKQIAHVSFSSPDLQRIIAFYRRVFGAVTAHEFRNQTNELYGVFLQIAPGCYLEFFRSTEDSQAINGPGRFRHFCIEVTDIAALVQDLNTKGFTPEVTRSRSDQTLQCWIEDCDGNRIEFHQYDGHSALFKR